MKKILTSLFLFLTIATSFVTTAMEEENECNECCHFNDKGIEYTNKVEKFKNSTIEFKNGDKVIRVNMGALYQNLAMHYFMGSTKLGCPAGMSNLATVQLIRENLPDLTFQLLTKALKLFELPSYNGQRYTFPKSNAYNNMGTYYIHTKGDRNKAFQYYFEAAKLDNQPALNMLGKFYGKKLEEEKGYHIHSPHYPSVFWSRRFFKLSKADWRVCIAKVTDLAIRN